MADQAKTLRIDIVSDVVCPWCIVGYLQLQAAVEETKADVEIHWQPFELNPQMPTEGQNLRAHVAEKYGSSEADSERSRTHLTELGKALDFEFNFTGDSRIFNTFDAHQLIHWADSLGRGNDMKQALFNAYFTDQKDISDDRQLVGIVERAGFDPTEAADVLASQKFAAAVRERQKTWAAQGIQSVPTIVFDSKYAVSGAQGADQFALILQRVLAKDAEAQL